MSDSYKFKPNHAIKKSVFKKSPKKTVKPSELDFDNEDSRSGLCWQDDWDEDGDFEKFNKGKRK